MITLIAAVAHNNCIGKKGALPWHLPEDLAHFKQLTIGHVVVMGRKTWESIPEKFRPLPGRKNIVVTRNIDYPLPPDVTHAASLEDALAQQSSEDIFVIGGAEIYALAMPHATRLEITQVDRDVEGGDAFFPAIDPMQWKEVSREPHEGFAFVTYDRASTEQ
jgi:dihydrofolate reductase